MERSLSISSGEISKKAPRTGTGLLSVVFSHCFCRHFEKNQLGEGLRCLIYIIGRSCRKYHFCRDKSFVSTNTCLSRQKTIDFNYSARIMAPKVLSRLHACLAYLEQNAVLLRDFVFSFFLSFIYSRELISQSVPSDYRGRNFRVGIFVWQSRSEVRNRFINL